MKWIFSGDKARFLIRSLSYGAKSQPQAAGKDIHDVTHCRGNSSTEYFNFEKKRLVSTRFL